MSSKNNFLYKQRKIKDLQNIYNDLKNQNKYQKLKDDYLKELFKFSAYIIKIYIHKIDKINVSEKNEIKNEIYENILTEFQKQNIKQKEDLSLLSSILQSLQLKIKDFYNEYLNKIELEEKKLLSLENFRIINKINEKDSIIKKMKNTFEFNKQYNFLKELNREIYLNHPLNNIECVNLNLSNKSNNNLKKINKQILKSECLNKEKIKDAIKCLNEKIKQKKTEKIKNKINKGLIAKIYNERYNTKLIINMNNLDSDESDCSSNSDNFSFEGLNTEIEQIDYDSYNSNIFDKISNNLIDKNNYELIEELNTLKKTCFKLRKNRNHYLHKINQIKNINKKMSNYSKKLKNTIICLQNPCINCNYLLNNQNNDLLSKGNKDVILSQF